MTRNIHPENIPGGYTVVLLGNTAGSSRKQIAQETLTPDVRPLGSRELTYTEARGLRSSWHDLLRRHGVHGVAVKIDPRSHT